MSQVIQRADIGMAKLPLDEAKTRIGGILSVASDHEMQPYGVVQTCEDLQNQVLHHGVVLIVATAVVSMQTGVGFAENIMAEKVVQHANNRVCPLSCVTGFINNEVHLPWDGFAAHSKDGGLRRC